jgi:hypothetical protein
MPVPAHTRYGSFGSDVSVTLKDTFDLQARFLEVCASGDSKAGGILAVLQLLHMRKASCFDNIEHLHAHVEYVFGHRCKAAWADGRLIYRCTSDAVSCNVLKKLFSKCREIRRRDDKLDCASRQQRRMCSSRDCLSQTASDAVS